MTAEKQTRETVSYGDELKALDLQSSELFSAFQAGKISPQEYSLRTQENQHDRGSIDHSIRESMGKTGLKGLLRRKR